MQNVQFQIYAILYVAVFTRSWIVVLLKTAKQATTHNNVTQNIHPKDKTYTHKNTKHTQTNAHKKTQNIHKTYIVCLI